MANSDLKSDKGFLKFIEEILTHDSVTIKIRNFKQAQRIATYIANLPLPEVNLESKKDQPSPMMIEMAIKELLLNAIEHGMLKINYDLKTKLLQENRWDKYVDEELLKLPKDKFIKIICILSQKDNNIKVTIIDPGDGFKLDENVNLDPSRKHGRGCMLAKEILDKL